MTGWDRSARGPVLLLGLGAAQGLLWSEGLGPGEGAAGFARRAGVMGALYVAALALAWHRRDRATVLVIVALGLGFRAAAFTWSPELSSDLHRYVWDGRVQEAGLSPYAAPPEAPALAPLRDDTVWPRINRPHAVTVYPPGAQLAFLGLARLGLGSVAGVKLAALFADACALLLLGVVLARRRLPGGRLAVYAWCPLVIAETAVSGHLDALVLPLALAAVMLARSRRPAWAGAAIGAAASLKLYPLLLLGAIPGKARPVAAAAAAALLAATYLPYAAASGVGVLGFLPQYVGRGEDFNIGVRAVVEAALVGGGRLARPAAMAVCTAGLLGAAYAVARRAADEPWRAARSLVLAFVLLLPTAMHPWYALWLVPFLVVEPSPAGVWLIAVLPLSYLKYGSAADVVPPWVRVAEWAPAWLLVGGAWLRRAGGGPVAVARPEAP